MSDPVTPTIATIVLNFPGWRWRSYAGTVPAALVALDSQVFFPGDVARGFRFELAAAPGAHTLTVILGSNARSIGLNVEAGKVYEIPLNETERGMLKKSFDSVRSTVGASKL
jgi:hypothetical protein